MVDILFVPVFIHECKTSVDANFMHSELCIFILYLS